MQLWVALYTGLTNYQLPITNYYIFMLVIKLKRIGKKHQAAFRVIVQEKRTKLNGRFVEDLGWLNPKSRDFNLKKERIDYWLQVGAKTTPTVHNLLVRGGVVKAKKIPVHKKRKEKAEGPKEAVQKESAAKPEAEVKAEAPK